MANQKFGANQRRGNEPSLPTQDERGSNRNASHSASSGAMKSKQKAVEFGSTMTSQVQGVLDQQVVKGARMVSNVANSARRAAEELETETPQAAGLVRGMADRLEEYSRILEHQSATEIYQAASDFTRRQPALVFGVATLAGFFMLRTLRSSQTDSAPGSVGRRGGRSQREEFHGS